VSETRERVPRKDLVKRSKKFSERRKSLANPVVEEFAVPSPKATWSKEPWSKAETQWLRRPSPQHWQGDRPKDWHKERPEEWKRDQASNGGKREAYVEVVDKCGKGSATPKSSPTRGPEVSRLCGISTVHISAEQRSVQG